MNVEIELHQVSDSDITPEQRAAQEQFARRIAEGIDIDRDLEVAATLPDTAPE